MTDTQNTYEPSEAVKTILDGGNIIPAIKLIRQETGCSLAEAKQHAENYQRAQKIANGEPVDEEPTYRSKPNGGLLLFLILGALAYAAYRFFT